MNKRKRMAALKHRRRLRKLKERRRAQALASLAAVTVEPVVEVSPEAPPKKRVIRRKPKAPATKPAEVSAKAPPAPKKRGRPRKEAPATPES